MVHFQRTIKKERKCTCGSWDCFEAYASGNGLRQTGAEIFQNDSITTYDIIEKAQNGDELAQKTLQIWQDDIALGILGLNNMFDTDCFVLSGSMGKFVDVEKITEFVNKHTVCTPTKVFHATTGNHAGMIGAVMLGNELI